MVGDGLCKKGYLFFDGSAWIISYSWISSYEAVDTWPAEYLLAWSQISHVLDATRPMCESSFLGNQKPQVQQACLFSVYISSHWPFLALYGLADLEGSPSLSWFVSRFYNFELFFTPLRWGEGPAPWVAFVKGGKGWFFVTLERSLKGWYIMNILRFNRVLKQLV